MQKWFHYNPPILILLLEKLYLYKLILKMTRDQILNQMQIIFLLLLLLLDLSFLDDDGSLLLPDLFLSSLSLGGGLQHVGTNAFRLCARKQGKAGYQK